MAQAIPVVTHAANTAEGADLTEGYVSQAAAMGRGDLLSGHLRLEATLNAEGLTMARGELSTGAFGEGYVDRRHPHTYLHELVASGLRLRRSARLLPQCRTWVRRIRDR